MKLHRFLSATLVAVGLSLFGSANAAKLGVRVLDANSGLPVANASVCIGTGSEPSKYGTAVTSYDGMALYDNVPQKPVLITVSKRNFRGIALQAPVNGSNVIKDVLVTEGLSSKKCRALKMVSLKPGISRGETKVEWPLEISALSYFPSGDDGLSFLSYSRGKPTHYRVSTHADFKGAEWKVYSDVLHFAPTGRDRGKSVLYFQLMKLVRAEGGTIEARSEVLSQAVHIQ
ncbi:MAG: hypothetical protein AAF404_06730 [Pseudomonadota bacterium]